ncbi:aquaporin, Major intrinsic protein family [Rhizoctonia solani]|uniref:Aquaporin, Major intrinsic protein family n=1 Tax=Rhizoctonia solani TaxID=456999 RepID=A0A8H8NYT7_9AGAM|nr:aquaporin, Major intrinsic protein family [Rhizoctonia solani]QRW20826.1 aquaporin, Major intrinsic protein family [Rhizoctonia solani]
MATIPPPRPIRLATSPDQAHELIANRRHPSHQRRCRLHRTTALNSRLHDQRTMFYNEALGTFLLVFVVLAVTDKRNGAVPGFIVPLALFMVLLSASASIGSQTGFALNPARDLGPRLLCWFVGYGRDVWNYRAQYWLYAPIMGPFVGLVAATIYDLLLYPSEGNILYSYYHRFRKDPIEAAENGVSNTASPGNETSYLAQKETLALLSGSARRSSGPIAPDPDPAGMQKNRTTNKSPSRAAPKATESAALVELPSADLIPSSISEPAPGRGSKVMLGPNRLKLVTDDALDSILRPSPRLGHSIYERGQNSVQAWVETSTRTSQEASRKPEEEET